MRRLDAPFAFVAQSFAVFAKFCGFCFSSSCLPWGTKGTRSRLGCNAAQR